ncbi:MAG: sirohydrochlorin chelatase [Micromonosporaceae bacterium]|nr:sirohydrochlorin chelatase [Micromonosporaceae bacterium]
MNPASRRPAGSGPVLVLAAHGTAWRCGLATAEAIARRVGQARPELTVRLAYLDVARPRLPDVLAGCQGEVVVVPLLLSTGYHVRLDIPAVVAGACCRARVAPPLGPDPLLATALADRLTGAGWPDQPTGARRGGVVLAAAGSREPQTASQVAAMAGLLEHRLGRPVTPAYVHSGVSGVVDLRTAVRGSPRRPTIATYLLADGYFARQVAAAAVELGAPVAAPIGAHPALVTLVLRRYAEVVGQPQPGVLRRGVPRLDFSITHD